ncbi:MAG: FliH/SctL family protein [Rubrivivax sp.]|nr:FliH/SctL family protein [Rubrivivax sp.]
MSNSSKPMFKNIPPPEGSKAGNAYTRFIPREELGDFAAWRPDSLFDKGNPTAGSAAPGAAPTAAEPDSAEWQARIAAARQAGYQDGYRDGLVALDGFKQSYATQLSTQLGQLVKSFDAQLDRLDHELAGSVARTAVQLARQVLRSELASDPALIAKVADEAINAVLLSARHISVHVHPLDLPLVAAGAAEALQARGARLLAHAGVERGGVLVESDAGAVDARIGIRWAKAAAVLGTNEAWDAPDATGAEDDTEVEAGADADADADEDQESGT